MPKQPLFLRVRGSVSVDLFSPRKKKKTVRRRGIISPLSSFFLILGQYSREMGLNWRVLLCCSLSVTKRKFPNRKIVGFEIVVFFGAVLLLFPQDRSFRRAL